VPDEKSFHMTPDEFRRHGHAVVDWIADYHSRIESFPVLSQVKPGEIRASLPPNAPTQGEPFEALLKDVEKLILPGVTHWQSPNFFAYFPCNASGPGILGDLLSSDLAFRACCGRRARRARSWKRMCSTGLCACWIAGEVSFVEYRRWSDSRYGVERRAVRAAGRARTRHELH